MTDVWESREQFEDFSRAQIEPYTSEVGIDKPPRVQVFEVHNYLGAPVGASTAS